MPSATAPRPGTGPKKRPKPRAHGAAGTARPQPEWRGRLRAGAPDSCEPGRHTHHPRSHSHPPRVHPPAGHALRPLPLRSPRACASQVSGRTPGAGIRHLRPPLVREDKWEEGLGDIKFASKNKVGRAQSSPPRARSRWARPDDGVKRDSKGRGVRRSTSLSSCRAVEPSVVLGSW